MNILINATNIKLGGGLQVADSICRSLNDFPQHSFTVVLSSHLTNTASSIQHFPNVSQCIYDIKNSLSTLLFGRDKFLDQLVKIKHIDCVITIFGPSRWEPRCAHICGFARLQLVYPESPYYRRMGIWEAFKNRISNRIMKYFFIRHTKLFYSENSWVSERVEKCFKGSRCFTVTNYYNQVFDQIDRWKDFAIPSFDGYTVLNVGTNYPHKNLGIIKEIAAIFKNKYPDVKIRFLLTLKPEEFVVPEDIKHMFLLVGKVDIASCPSLYKQSDVMLQPSLLECFSATYPEAMRMRIPIITTDLDFSRGLCGDAALYYSPLDANDAVAKLQLVIQNKQIANKLVDAGVERLKAFDTYRERPRKLVELCENILALRNRK